jgi:hypothetical protein
MSNYKGIDYGMGLSNINHETGIRYGVIPQNAVGQSWYDSSEGFYGEPSCPKCGNAVVDIDHPDIPDLDLDDIADEWECSEHECRDYACLDCKYVFGGESAYSDEALSYYIDDEEYSAECDGMGDIFITKSPYYTRAQYCSPCAPGACYLSNPVSTGEKAYCFGPDWFDNDDEYHSLPYPVYSVETDELIDWPTDYFDFLFIDPTMYGSRSGGLIATCEQWAMV